MSEDLWKSRYLELEREQDDARRRWEQAEALLRRLAARLCLAARGLGAELDAVLDRIQDLLRGPLQEGDLEQALGALSEALARTETPAVQRARDDASLRIEDDLRGALDDLLGGLELDPGLQPRVAELRGLLQQARGLEDAVGFCAQLSDLIAAQRERSRLAQADLQRVLQQVDSRLSEFLGYLKGEAAEREAASASRRELDERMRGEVRDLTASVQQAQDLEALRSQVAQRLEAMDAHLRAFRLRESARAEAYRERAERMRSRVEQLEAETRRLRESLAREQVNATTDPLTGIPNRLAYEQRVALEYRRWKRFGRPLCLVVWDIDRFKAINDEHGHQAGDVVIREVAQRLARQVRATDFVARTGGEEFVMLLVDTAPDAAMAVVEKLRARIAERSIQAAAAPLQVTVSAGLAEFRGEEDPDAVFARADAALYRAKRAGRNRVERG
ncbi:MAG: hypothetical protein KatS3mg126_0127 [Lysobacteraceae bacterium]|nr:MAG: hypothetical protein KatS3mg126_0127 [Xanthomonadaceae bacterium]